MSSRYNEIQQWNGSFLVTERIDRESGWARARGGWESPAPPRAGPAGATGFPASGLCPSVAPWWKLHCARVVRCAQRGKKAWAQLGQRTGFVLLSSFTEASPHDLSHRAGPATSFVGPGAKRRAPGLKIWRIARRRRQNINTGAGDTFMKSALPPGPQGGSEEREGARPPGGLRAPGLFLLPRPCTGPS